MHDPELAIDILQQIRGAGKTILEPLVIMIENILDDLQEN
jgi:hypothetical protein